MKVMLCSLFLMSALALPFQLTIQTQPTPLGSGDAARFLQREINTLSQNTRNKEWNYVDQNIQTLKSGKQIISDAYLNNQSIGKDARQNALNLDNAIDSIMNIWNSSRDKAKVASDARQLVNYVELLLKSLGISIQTQSLGPIDTVKSLQSDILELNQRISQGNWNIDQNIQKLKTDKQKIGDVYLNNQSISKEARQNALNLDNAIDSIFNLWNSSRDKVKVAVDAVQLGNFVDVLSKSLGSNR
jgi:methylthioribose-1-phosphate isomerase